MGNSIEPPIQPLTIFLIKTGVAEFKSILETPDVLTQMQFKQSVDFDGAIFLSPQRKNPPQWLSFLNEGSQNKLKDLLNTSTSAVLIVRASRRIFALTFGYGRALIRADKIERSFGLRVVLNTVDEDNLQSVDTKTVQELTVYTRRQISRASRLSEFGIDKEEDILGAVAGIPRDPKFARMVSGADALQLRAHLRFIDLRKKCSDCYRAYRSNDYKERGFEFVDHVRIVTDPVLIKNLEENFIDDLTGKKWDRMHMAPPNIINWETVEGFSFTKAADPAPDLRIESLFDHIRNANKLSVDRLKHQKVFVHSSNTADPIPQWSVLRVIVTEQDYKSRHYVLSGGDWFQLDGAFVERVTAQVGRIKSANLKLPAACPEENEADYNKRVALRRGIYCIDRKCPRIAGDPIELCDLYTNKHQFVHVKHWKASSTLSHLFAQGRISAETFLSDEKFRKEARKILKKQSCSIDKHIPIHRPNPNDYQVVFAIIKGGGRGWKRSLPFFSQLNLIRSADALRRLGLEVRLEQIKVKAQ